MVPPQTTQLEHSLEQWPGVCDIVGDAFRLWRRNLKLIFQVILGPTLVQIAGGTLMQGALLLGSSMFATLTAGAAQSPVEYLAPIALMGVGVLGFFIFIWGIIQVFVRELALVRLFTGFAPDWESARNFARRPERIAWIVLLGALSFMALSLGIGLTMVVTMITVATIGALNIGAAGAVFATVIGAGGCVAAVFVVSVILAVAWLALALLACEDCTVLTAVSRSIQLIKSRPGRASAFCCILFVVISIFNICASLPCIAVTLADFYIHGFPGGPAGETARSAARQPSAYVIVFNQVWEILANMMLRPIFLFAFALLYLDLRQRQDGVDLQRRLQILKEKVVSGQAK